MIRTRHIRLDNALIDLEEKGGVIVVEVPEGMKPVYYQRYAARLAHRDELRIKTSLRFKDRKWELLMLKRG